MLFSTQHEHHCFLQCVLCLSLYHCALVMLGVVRSVCALASSKQPKGAAYTCFCNLCEVRTRCKLGACGTHRKRNSFFRRSFSSAFLYFSRFCWTCCITLIFTYNVNSVVFHTFSACHMCCAAPKNVAIGSRGSVSTTRTRRASQSEAVAASDARATLRVRCARRTLVFAIVF